MAKSKLWKWFEGKVGIIGKDLMSSEPVRFIRFHDTHAAQGRYLPAQPGDFAAVVPGGCALIEVKTSEEHESLTQGFSSLMSKRQAAEHRMWNRTGNPSLIIFYSGVSENVELWEGEYAAPIRVQGRQLDLANAVVCGISDLHEHLRNFLLKKGKRAWKKIK